MNLRDLFEAIMSGEQSQDNRMTNRMVDRGQLPQNQRENVPQRAGVRSQKQIQSSPFRMFEDQSFQGDPSQFRGANPGYKFYEDNTFEKTFPQRPQYEDDSLMAGQQGFSPISADIKNFQRPQNFNQRQPQYEDGSPLYEVQPNVNPMFRGGFNPQQDYRNRLKVR